MMNLLQEFPKYWKFFLSLFGAAIIALQAAITDSVVTGEEWWTVGIALVTSLSVYAKGNE